MKGEKAIMKQFFESYGGVALGILALLVLIAMITPVGNIIKTSLQSTTNKFASSMNSQMDDAMIATAEAQESATQTPIDLTNINKNGVVGDFSAKGNLVTINGTQYRVLEVNGSRVKVISMTDIGSSTFNGSNVTTSFGSYTGRKYADSNLDNKMITYYNSLPSLIQDAIIEQNISQSMYSVYNGTNSNASFSAWFSRGFTASTISGTNYYLQRIAEINVGIRKVYALDVDDVIAYLGSNSTPQDVNEMFFGVRNNTSSVVWLRSANANHSINAIGVGGISGILSTYSSGNAEVRPVFVLNLSLLS